MFFLAANHLKPGICIFGYITNSCKFRVQYGQAMVVRRVGEILDLCDSITSQARWIGIIYERDEVGSCRAVLLEEFGGKCRIGMWSKELPGGE